MPHITIELLRKRVEHNEGEIHSVEELSLHQEKIEKLENLDKWCKKLKILLLHNNLISKIENVNRLKELEYLNLALNNIERIENLEGCESLMKLDLTLNFIGEITSVSNLKHNSLLENLYLTGNPCVDFPGYRKYVINALPQLKSLDGTDVTTTERLTARQEIRTVERDILRAEAAYKAEREVQKQSYVEELGSSDSEDNDEYWNKVTPNTPEIRRELTLKSLKLENKSKEAKSGVDSKKKERKEVSLFYSDGRPKNINQPKTSFDLQDTEDALILDLALPRFMDSSLIVADVQPTYTRCVIKGKIFQIVLPEEVKPDASIAQRSKTTGHLVVTMPKLHQSSQGYRKDPSIEKTGAIIENAITTRIAKPKKCSGPDGDASKCVDWRNIIPPEKKSDGEKFSQDLIIKEENSDDTFVDDSNVPPLI